MPHIGDWRKYIYTILKKNNQPGYRITLYINSLLSPLKKKKNFFSSAYQQISNKKG